MGQEADGEGLCVRGGRRGTVCGGTSDGAGQGGTIITRGGRGRKQGAVWSRTSIRQREGSPERANKTSLPEIKEVGLIYYMSS